ncbi:MAG: DUF4351 domain-containing protein [Gammaproteobacteria bacterium]|nr:DUF4351 domain-containing protein [Gammaproteobacteria bacterium]MDE0367605.1 DUF4351 domain-containing protein [Gammaproteobacteria bacterium]
MSNTVSHDQNFKNLILDYPSDSLAFFAPEEAPGPDDQVSIVPVRQEQLKERLGNRFRELDVPLLVEWADGRREAVLFVLEEESDARRFSLHRLAHYCLDLAELFETDRVVPVAVFLRKAETAPASLTLGTGRSHYLTFNTLACKLREIPAERWLGSNNLVARLNLPNMQSPPNRKVEVYAEAISGLLTLERDSDKRAKYIEFIDIYAGLTDNEYRRYRQQYREDSSTMAGIISRAREEGVQQGIEQGITQGIEQGMTQGIEQGMRQGRVEGERALLERQLRRRFGLLSPEVAEKLGGAAAADLETWAENVLDASTIDDVFASRH